MTMLYRNFHIEHRPKIIPQFDWEFCHVDYDGSPSDSGGPPIDRRFGFAFTLEEAKEAIDDLILEIEDDA